MKTIIRQIIGEKGGSIHSISPDASVFDALKIMAEKNVGALIVMDNGKLSGVVSERDYARKVFLLGRSSPDTRVRDIMTTEVLCARPEQSVGEALSMMTQKAVRHLPVLEKKQIIGIVSIGDLVKSIIDEQSILIQHLENYIHGQ